MSKKLKFNELKINTIYRLLHGGEKDHGYNYTLHEDGSLYNLSKGKRSSLSFNANIRFIETNEKFKSYPNLDFKIEFTSQSIVIGCQTIDGFTAQRIAIDILEHFGGE